MSARKMAPQRRKAPAETAARSGASTLGTGIRRLRTTAGWSLSELGKRSGIAVSTLSKVENGLLTLNYDRLQQIASALDLSLSEFLSAINAPQPRSAPTARLSWARRGSGAEVSTPNYDYNYLCDNLRLKAMVPILSRCKARTMGEFGPLLRHEGEEFIFVVRGQVAVHTEIYGAEVLNAGEGVYLDSRMGHAYLQAGEEEAWILSVNSV